MHGIIYTLITIKYFNKKAKLKVIFTVCIKNNCKNKFKNFRINLSKEILKIYKSRFNRDKSTLKHMRIELHTSINIMFKLYRIK